MKYNTKMTFAVAMLLADCGAYKLDKIPRRLDTTNVQFFDIPYDDFDL